MENLIGFKEFDIQGKIKSDKKISKDVLKEEFTGGVDADVESKNLFGFAGVKDQTIKKIGSFTSFTKMINPPTPKERPVLNAGQFIDNDKVQGYVNRIEGSKVFVESLEKPGEIVEISIKDAVKIKKEQKEHTITKKIKEFNSFDKVDELVGFGGEDPDPKDPTITNFKKVKTKKEKKKTKDCDCKKD